MSNVRKSIRVKNDTNSLIIDSGETTWSRVHSKEFTVTTTDATTTNAASILLDDNTVTRLDATIVGRCTTSVDGAAYNISAVYYRSGGGSATAIGVPLSDARSTGGASGWSVGVSTSTNTVNITVTGVAGATINWLVILQDIKRT